MLVPFGRNGLIAACLGIFLTGCIAYPAQDPADSECRLISHSYTLTLYRLDNMGGSCSGDARACLVAFAIIPATSLVVAGSIVAVGNTVNWLERQGRCSTSVVQRHVADWLGTGKNAGGYVLRSAEDAMRWVRSDRSRG